MLSRARELLGLVSASTSTKTQESNAKYVEANARGYYFYDTLALSLITNTFVEASYMFTHTGGSLPKRHKQYLEASKQAYAFISGTGLEIMIQAYNMDYDADMLRDMFYAKFKIKA